jgi:hypothetical protein
MVRVPGALPARQKYLQKLTESLQRRERRVRARFGLMQPQQRFVHGFYNCGRGTHSSFYASAR